MNNNHREIVCFFHGLGSSSRAFLGIDRKLSGQGYQILNRDFPGFGRRSGCKVDLESPFKQCVEELYNDVRSYEFVHIVAHSMGGAIGLKFAEAVGLERVASFTNFEGNLSASDSGLLSKNLANVQPDRVSFKLEQIIETQNLREIHSWEGWISDVGLVQPEILIAFAKSLDAASASGQLQKQFVSLRCPKTYCYSPSNAEHPVLELLPDNEVNFHRNSNHFIMLDDPVESLRVISNNLSFK